MFRTSRRHNVTCSLLLNECAIFPVKRDPLLYVTSYSRDECFQLHQPASGNRSEGAITDTAALGSLFTVRLRLERNRTTDPLFRRWTLYPLSHTAAPASSQHIYICWSVFKLFNVFIMTRCSSAVC